MILTIAAAWQPGLGYPVHVHLEDGKCRYGIQDMIMLRPKDVRDWMKELSDKRRQIDIVWSLDDARRCADKARNLVRSAGFSNIVVRRSGGEAYPPGTPPE